MKRLSLYSASILALVLSGTATMANPLTCGTLETGGNALPLCVSESAVIVAATETLRVPNGKTYQVQIGGSKFQKFTSGAVVPGTDCVLIKCPSTFGSDVTCWKCVGNLKSN